jgi:hypothetical protein
MLELFDKEKALEKFKQEYPDYFKLSEYQKRVLEGTEKMRQKREKSLYFWSYIAKLREIDDLTQRIQQILERMNKK